MLHYEWIIKTLMKKLRISREFDEFYNLGLFFLFEGIYSYDETKGTKLSTYLYQCVRFGFLKELENLPPNDLSYEKELEHFTLRFKSTPSFEKEWIECQYLLSFLETFDHLTRQIFYLWILGYSYSEIAIRTNQSVGFIKRTLHRKRKELKALKKEKD